MCRNAYVNTISTPTACFHISFLELPGSCALPELYWQTTLFPKYCSHFKEATLHSPEVHLFVWISACMFILGEMFNAGFWFFVEFLFFLCQSPRWLKLNKKILPCSHNDVSNMQVGKYLFGNLQNRILVQQKRRGYLENHCQCARYRNMRVPEVALASLYNIRPLDRRLIFHMCILKSTVM